MGNKNSKHIRKTPNSNDVRKKKKTKQAGEIIYTNRIVSTDDARSPWSQGDMRWVEDTQIKTLYFLDNCINIKQPVTLDAVKVISFPEKLKGMDDDVVLMSVIEFIKQHSILTERGLEFYIVSVDRDFRRDANAKAILKKSEIEIKFIVINISILVAEQMKLAYGGDKRWLETV